MLLTIGELATTLGVSVVTLRRWDKAGTLKPYLRTPGGHRRYLLAEVLKGLVVAQTGPEAGRPQKLVVGYARVSSHDQDDLVRALTINDGVRTRLFDGVGSAKKPRLDGPWLRCS